VDHFFHQMIITFHHIISEQSGNDVTIARAKTMVALVSLTWPDKGVVVSHQVTSQGRILWKSEDFDSLSIGGSFRRDPVGDDASLAIDEDEVWEKVMLEEMRECSEFIPLFGRQRLERFNRTLAELHNYRERALSLPEPETEPCPAAFCSDEYNHLYDWLLKHGTITKDGQWTAPSTVQ